MNWLNEPPTWSFETNRLSLSTGHNTDFWRETHYGFVRDSGHLFFLQADGDFTASVRFQGSYEELYDQAGLMVRLDERNWVKAGIEFSDGVQNLSVVSTRDFSDWSVLPLDEPPEWVWLRFSRLGDAIRVDWSPDGSSFQMVRLTYLKPEGPAQIGMMACSPQRSGFRATFEKFEVGPPIGRDLHA